MIFPTLNYDFRLYQGDTNGKPAGATFTRASAGMRVNALGLLESSVSGVLRHDFDPITGEYLGILLEGTSTNLCLRSQELDQWSANNATVTANAAAAPDGTLTADKIVTTNANQQQQRYRGVSFSAGQTLCWSFFLKSAEYTKAFVHLYGATATGDLGLDVDLAAGTVAAHNNPGTGTTVVGSGIINLGGGKYLVWVSGIVNATDTSANFALAPIPVAQASPYNPIYLGDAASGIYAWGGQVEVGSFPSSHMPTAAATATRAADILTVPLNSFAFNSSEGTLLVRGRSALAVPPGGSAQMLAVLDDGSANNVLQLYRAAGSGAASVWMTNAGVGQAVPASVALGNKSAFALALAYKAGELAFVKDGGAVATSAPGALPAGLTTLRLGSDNSGGGGMNGHIRHAAYFPRRLSNADLQAITL